MVDEDMMELDDVIEEEGDGEENLAMGLVILTTVAMLAAIVIVLIKLGNDYQAGILG